MRIIAVKDKERKSQLKKIAEKEDEVREMKRVADQKALEAEKKIQLAMEELRAVHNERQEISSFESEVAIKKQQ